MIEFSYLAKGLNAMSRAHRTNTMSGHLGAAVVAGYFIGEQHTGLDKRVYAGIESELNRIISGQSVFTPKDKSGVTAGDLFESHPKMKPDLEQLNGIAEALESNIGETHQSGHNVIFAAIAIRALKDHPEYATLLITDGIRKLIKGFDGTTPGNGYYGKERGRVDGRKIKLPADDDFPVYEDLNAMARVVVDDLIKHGAERRQGYGGLFHVINHGAALIELAQYGFKDLAVKGLQAHHHHVRLWRSLPDVSVELGAETAATHSPLTPQYWTSGVLRRDSARLTHRIKTLYGYYVLIDQIEEEMKCSLAAEKLRYLM